MRQGHDLLGADAENGYAQAVLLRRDYYAPTLQIALRCAAPGSHLAFVTVPMGPATGHAQGSPVAVRLNADTIWATVPTWDGATERFTLHDITVRGCDSAAAVQVTSVLQPAGAQWLAVQRVFNARDQVLAVGAKSTTKLYLRHGPPSPQTVALTLNGAALNWQLDGPYSAQWPLAANRGSDGKTYVVGLSGKGGLHVAQIQGGTLLPLGVVAPLTETVLAGCVVHAKNDIWVASNSGEVWHGGVGLAWQHWSGLAALLLPEDYCMPGGCEDDYWGTKRTTLWPRRDGSLLIFQTSSGPRSSWYLGAVTLSTAGAIASVTRGSARYLAGLGVADNGSIVGIDRNCGELTLADIAPYGGMVAQPGNVPCDDANPCTIDRAVGDACTHVVLPDGMPCAAMPFSVCYQHGQCAAVPGAGPRP